MFFFCVEPLPVLFGGVDVEPEPQDSPMTPSGGPLVGPGMSDAAVVFDAVLHAVAVQVLLVHRTYSVLAPALK